jgi:hypothetical protein
MKIIDDAICIVKLTPVSDVQCTAEIIINGSTSVLTIPIEMEEAAHMEIYEEYVDDVGYKIQFSKQVGEGGLVPFKHKLKTMYPNAILIDPDQFDMMVEAQKEAMADIKSKQTKH